MGAAEEAIRVAAPHDLNQGTGRAGPPLTAGPGPDGTAGPGPDAAQAAAGWTIGRIVSAVIGAVLALCALGALSAGGAAVWADATQRHGGYVHLGTASYATAGHALASARADRTRLHHGPGAPGQHLPGRRPGRGPRALT